jgi:hypothetical protein
LLGGVRRVRDRGVREDFLVQPSVGQAEAGPDRQPFGELDRPAEGAPHDAQERGQAVLGAEGRVHPAIVVAGATGSREAHAEADRKPLQAPGKAQVRQRHVLVLDARRRAEPVVVLDAEIAHHAGVEVELQPGQPGEAGRVRAQRQRVTGDGEIGAAHADRLDPEADGVEPVQGMGRPRQAAGEDEKGGREARTPVPRPGRRGAYPTRAPRPVSPIDHESEAPAGKGRGP